MPNPQHRRLFPNRVSLGFLAWMVLLAILLVAGGAYYAVLKNEQIAVKRDIDRIRLQIATCKLTAEQYRAKTGARTNRWAIRDRLSQDGSALRDITPGQIELVHAPALREVALLLQSSPCR